MKLYTACVLYIIVVFIQNSKAQCPPTAINTLITGFYTLDINPSPGTVVYITPTATVTGNINLTNASLFNCGLILSPKIVMKKSSSIFQLTFENNGIIKTDSIVMDSLSHFHNNDTLICKSFKMINDAQASNLWVMDLGSLLIKDQSYFDSNGNTNADNLELIGHSSFYNQYGHILVRKLFKNGINCTVNGILFMCVDSCFLNDGIITNSAMNTWSPFINISGLSENTGTINSPNFCDMTSSNGGMLDVNTGTVNITSYCTTQQYSCEYIYASVKENNITLQFSIYPNPTNLILNIIDEQHKLQNSVIEIKNHLGEIMLVTPFAKQVNISFLPAGMYFLTIENNISKKTIKMIKE